MKESNEYLVNLKVTKKFIWKFRNKIVHSHHNNNKKYEKNI